MAKRLVTLSFTEETIAEPVIYSLGQQFSIVTNIRQAHLTEDRGWIILELEGEEANIEAAITWAVSKGVRAEPVIDEVSHLGNSVR